MEQISYRGRQEKGTGPAAPYLVKIADCHPGKGDRLTLCGLIHASLDQLTFDPDILIITANARQAEILLRASSYSSGKMWNAKGSTCLACAWFYAYPYLTGELNYGVSGLGFSMKAREVLPEGLVIISIPSEMLSMMIENLREMEWEPHWFKLGRDGFVDGVKAMEARKSKEFPPDLVWG